MKYYYECHNRDDNVTGLVYTTTMRTKMGGQFAAALRDDDSGQIVTSNHGYSTVEQAAEQARFLAGVTK